MGESVAKKVSKLSPYGECREFKGGAMTSTIAKRSVVIGGHKTSVSLEEPFWQAVRDITDERKITISELLREIDQNRANANLSSAVRIFVLDRFRRQAEAARLRRSSGVASSALPPSAAAPD
jgi:predicted DNA-binding ribbon-helix-helix protein